MEKTNAEPQPAVILISHGSRAACADGDLERIAQDLRRKRGGIVEVCRLGGRGTPFPAALQRCLDQGAARIVVIPYFLHFGVHLRKDIPEMLRRAAEAHPRIRVVLGRHLGYDDLLVELLLKRIDEAEGRGDLRDLTGIPIYAAPAEGGEGTFPGREGEKDARG